MSWIIRIINARGPAGIPGMGPVDTQNTAPPPSPGQSECVREGDFRAREPPRRVQRVHASRLDATHDPSQSVSGGPQGARQTTLIPAVGSPDGCPALVLPASAGPSGLTEAGIIPAMWSRGAVKPGIQSGHGRVDAAPVSHSARHRQLTRPTTRPPRGFFAPNIHHSRGWDSLHARFY